MAAQATDFFDTHLGWATLIGSLIIAVVTIVYVVLTWRLVGVDRQATKEAQEANKLAQQAIASSQDANTLARQALDNDRRQYLLAVRNQQDAAVPSVVVEFAGSQIHGYEEASGTTAPVGQMSREDFDQLTVALDNNFDVTNQAPGPWSWVPALVWIEVESGFPIRVSVSNDVFTPPGPVLIGPGMRTFGLRLITTGYEAYETIGGTEYAQVKFWWAAYSQRDVYDEAHFALKAGTGKFQSGLLNDQTLATTFTRPRALLLPAQRTYPTVPDRN